MKEVKMPKQTSVEWFLNRFEELEYNRINRKNSWADSVKHLEMIFEKAKQMHKEEIKDAFNSGMVNSVDWFNDGITEESEQYYNETYGGQDV
jgi:hypothetical protein